MKRTFGVMACFLLLAACATSYRPYSILGGGGWRDVQLADDTFKVTFEAGGASGRTHNEVYRLDDAWLLRFGYHNGKNRFQDGTLIHAELIESPRHVWVAPPTNFSGVWITYFVNGQKADETAFTDGNRGVLDKK